MKLLIMNFTKKHTCRLCTFGCSTIVFTYVTIFFHFIIISFTRFVRCIFFFLKQKIITNSLKYFRKILLLSFNSLFFAAESSFPFLIAKCFLTVVVLSEYFSFFILFLASSVELLASFSKEQDLIFDLRVSNCSF